MRKCWQNKKVKWIVALLVGTAIAIILYSQEEIAKVELGEPSVQRREYSVALLNKTGRTIRYRMIGLQMKCNEMWVAHLPVASSSGSPGRIPSTPTIRFINPTSDSNFPADGVHELRGKFPLHMERPPGATAWRIAIEWSYSEPSRVQKWIGNFFAAVSGKPPMWKFSTEASVSTEVPF